MICLCVCAAVRCTVRDTSELLNMKYPYETNAFQFQNETKQNIRMEEVALCQKALASVNVNYYTWNVVYE